MRNLLLYTCCLLLGLPGYSQMGIGSTHSLFIQNGVTFSVDSLVLIPGTSITISNNTLTHNFTPATGPVPGSKSIARVYFWNTPIVYTGEVGLFYNDAELVGNTENLLQIAYRNLATWTTTATSTVNTTTNYVSYLAAGTPLDRVTATTAGVLLPITYTGFTAVLKDQYVLLSWQMGETDDLSSFDIEFSPDGHNWTVAASIAATDGKMDYSFQHSDPGFSIHYYRIAMLDHDGRRIYTRIASLRNNAATSMLRITRSGSSMILYFDKDAPEAVQLYDMQGRLVNTRPVAQQRCEIPGLVPGAYIIQYTIGGERLSKKVQFQ